jgi:hypothetical protein
MSKAFSLLILLATISRAQTAIAVGQLSCPASTAAQAVVAVPLGTIGSIPIIRLTCIALDPATLVLDTSAKPPVLRAVATGQSANFVDAEAPAGAIDGGNNSFSLSAIPASGSLKLYRNGVRQKAGLDYNLIGSAISFLAGSTPQAGDQLIADYRK